jgi:hypothetical protein
VISSNSAYVAGSIAVGIGQVVDAYVTLRLRGKWSDWLTTAFGLFEFVWAGASFLVWHDADPALPGWLPVSFIAWIIAGAAVGLVLIVQQRGSDEVQIPSDVTLAGGAFGVFFAFSAATCLANLR